MNPIYLSKVLLSNFRTYGPKTEISVNPGPGLTILCGMNGLGKTGFFEAIEWGFTGDVKRLSDKRGDLDRALTRLGVAPGSHAVELYFNDGSTIKRTRSEAPRHENMVALLRDSGWGPEIRDIGTYLRLTHFLPQASRQRFLEREESDKWQLLKGPAGVERLERYRALLNDGKARNAFRRSIEGLKSKQRDAAESLAQFKDVLARQRDLRALATAGAAFDPQQVEAEVGEMMAKVRELASEPDSTILASESHAEKLALLGTLIESHIVGLQQKLEILATAENALVKWNEIQAQVVAAETRLNSLYDELTSRRKSLEQVRGLLAAARTEFTRAELKHRAYKERAETLRRLVEARLKIESLESQLSLLNAKLVELRASVVPLEAQKKKNEEITQRRDDLLRMSAGLRESKASLDSAMELYNRAIAANRSAEEIAAGRASWAEKQSSAQQLKNSSATIIAEMERKRAGLLSRLETDQNIADVIAKAVAQIAIHITDADRICPVCAHSHDSGELVRKARESMESMRAGSVALAEELETMEAQLAAARGVHEKATSEEIDATAKLEDIDSILRHADELRVAVESNPLFVGTAFSDGAVLIGAKQAELRTRNEAVVRELATIPGADTLDVARTDNTNALNLLKSEIDSFVIQGDTWNQQLAQCRAVIASNVQLTEEMGSQGVDLENAHAQALHVLEDHVLALERTRATVDAFERNERVAQENLTNSEGGVAAAQRELADFTNTATIISKTWKDCGLVGGPSAAALEQRRSELAAGRAGLQALRERQRSAVKGVQLWTQNEELQRADEEITRTMTETESNDLAETERRLLDRVKLAEVALKRAEAAFSQAERIAVELGQKSESFSTASLEPLTARIAAFNDMISPFGYMYRLDAKLSATRGTRARQTIAISNPQSGKSLNCDPESFLSEGQSSALGLSVLLGSSIEYRWSRWPALLLDDPLQNTDLIHAAAFIDVIRGLMQDCGFQVIVSTHDMDEADFISRKCQRAKLPVTRIDLLGVGPNGLRTRTCAL